MDKIYQQTIEYIGQDASPKDKFRDEVSCTESVSNILKKIDQDMPIFGYTFDLLAYLQSRPDLYREVKDTEAKAGTVIIAPTGKGRGNIKHGHAVILGTNGLVYGTDYRTGLWGQNGSLSWFKKYFGERGGFPIYYFNYEKRN